MVRTPIFSIELYNQFLKSDNIDYDLILQNDIFKESIMTTTYNPVSYTHLKLPTSDLV